MSKTLIFSNLFQLKIRIDNIFLCNTGLRLIDVGISALKKQVGDRLFDRFVQQEKEELEAFRKFFLMR